jgi:geranylgeranyl diphosphate synthase type I
MQESEDTFGRFVARVRSEVDAYLASWLAARIEEARARGPDVGLVADAMRSLVMRGGKRMRAVLLSAAYLGCSGAERTAAVAGAGAALELLQAYLLAHDDWMDGDDTRRGGPSVPAMMRASLPDHSDAASVLAGDLAAAWAQQALLEVDLPPARVVLAARELARMQDAVVSGQLLDVRSRSRSLREVEALYMLKTASYSGRGPLVMGARLAGAPEAQVAALAAVGEPLGVAFQLRDDLLGAFGDPRATGKPGGGDLRRGKRTALVLEAMGDPRAAGALARVLGRADASDVEMASAIEALEASGARERVEARIRALEQDAREALGRADLSHEGQTVLATSIAALARRER